MRHLGLTLVLLALLLAGCSGKQSLRGRISFADNDEPLPCGTVYFSTPTFVAQGKINPDGTYIVGSFSEKDGIPAGTYQISIVGVEFPLENGEPSGKSLIAEKYASPETSGLSFTANGKTKHFDIQVDRAEAKKR